MDGGEDVCACVCVWMQCAQHTAIRRDEDANIQIDTGWGKTTSDRALSGTYIGYAEQ